RIVFPRRVHDSSRGSRDCGDYPGDRSPLVRVLEQGGYLAPDRLVCNCCQTGGALFWWHFAQSLQMRFDASPNFWRPSSPTLSGGGGVRVGAGVTSGGGRPGAGGGGVHGGGAAARAPSPPHWWAVDISVVDHLERLPVN